jgi:hypothetical protein
MCFLGYVFFSVLGVGWFGVVTGERQLEGDCSSGFLIGGGRRVINFNVALLRNLMMGGGDRGGRSLSVS